MPPAPSPTRTPHTPVRAALLGSGLFATNAYVPALLGVPGLDITAVWSRSEASATGLLSKAAELGGFPNGTPALHFGDDGLAAILGDSSIAAVVMVLPIGVQPTLVRKCWAAGKHVISEKPIGRDVHEAKVLIEEYEKEYQPKGILWRVAENYAHEPFLHYAAAVLRSPEVGAVLTYRMYFETMLPDGSSYHGTTWRTVPDYQGGFLLDGGVHWAAMLRTVLPAACRPAGVIAFKSLHRAHMVPHDTLVGLTVPPKAATVAPHGKATGVAAARGVDEMPVQSGQSTPTGSFTLTWAIPDTKREERAGNGLYVVCENATVHIAVSRPPHFGRSYGVTVSPGAGSAVPASEVVGEVSGVVEELADFAEAIAGKGEGENFGGPRDALWDLAFIQAALESDGKEVDIDKVLQS